MEIRVVNRRSVFSCSATEAKPHVLISIYDPADVPADLAPNLNRRGVLMLQFHDWDDKQKIVLDRSSTPDAKRMVFYNEQQAKQIFDFLQSHLASIELIICQCDAGISRSAGLAAALSKLLNGTDEYFFKHYIPNSRVYRLTLNCWMEQLEKK